MHVEDRLVVWNGSDNKIWYCDDWTDYGFGTNARDSMNWIDANKTVKVSSTVTSGNKRPWVQYDGILVMINDTTKAPIFTDTTNWGPDDTSLPLSDVIEPVDPFYTLGIVDIQSGKLMYTHDMRTTTTTRFKLIVHDANQRLMAFENSTNFDRFNNGDSFYQENTDGTSIGVVREKDEAASSWTYTVLAGDFVDSGPDNAIGRPVTTDPDA